MGDILAGYGRIGVDDQLVNLTTPPRDRIKALEPFAPAFADAVVNPEYGIVWKVSHPRLCERNAKARKFGKDHCIEKGCRHDRCAQRGAIDRQGLQDGYKGEQFSDVFLRHVARWTASERSAVEEDCLQSLTNVTLDEVIVVGGQLFELPGCPEVLYQSCADRNRALRSWPFAGQI